jgi:hypothetical protein
MSTKLSSNNYDLFAAIALQVALELAAVGIPIFPARIFKRHAQSLKWEKKPLIRGWQKGATTDPDQIRGWWDKYPNAVPGIETGRAGLVVLDADRHGGPDGVSALEQLGKGHSLPVGPVIETASNGRHHYFRQLEGRIILGSRGGLPQGIDIKGSGGWVVAPGSVRPDGASYRMAEGSPTLVETFPDKVPVLPTWIADLIDKKPTSSTIHMSGSLSKQASSSMMET